MLLLSLNVLKEIFRLPLDVNIILPLIALTCVVVSITKFPLLSMLHKHSTEKQKERDTQTSKVESVDNGEWSGGLATSYFSF